MNITMTTLLILIRQLDPSVVPVEGIAAAICPYLGTFGEQARIDSTERLQELRGGLHVAGATALHVILDGTAKADFLTLAAKLERFLRQTVKDAQVDARFEIFRVLLNEPAQGTGDTGTQ